MSSFIHKTRCVPCKSCRKAAAKVGPSAVYVGGYAVRCACGLSVHHDGKRTDAIAQWNDVQLAIAERRFVEGRA